jgi:hypothetical protein
MKSLGLGVDIVKTVKTVGYPIGKSSQMNDRDESRRVCTADQQRRECMCL